jgi:hypothetical protein
MPPGWGSGTHKNSWDVEELPTPPGWGTEKNQNGVSWVHF